MDGITPIINTGESFTYEFDAAPALPPAKAFHMCRHWPNCQNDNTASILGAKGRVVKQRIAALEQRLPEHRCDLFRPPVEQFGLGF